jgi:hypothetical protein
MLAVLFVTGHANAHHSFAMFDQKQVWTWEGTVEEFQWRQPHLHVIVLVPDNARDPRTVGRWDFEGASPNIAARQGWNKLVFKRGDRITVVGNPLRDGRKGGSIRYVITPEGKTLYHDVARDVTPEKKEPTGKPGAY